MLSSRKIIIVFIIFFLTAIFFASDFTVNFSTIWVILLPLALALFFLRNTKYILIAICVFAAVSGLSYYHYDKGKSSVSYYSEDTEYKIEGYISSYPNAKEKSTTFVLTDKHGNNYYVSANKFEDFRYGERIIVTSKIKIIQNEDEFSFRDYFSSRDIYHQIFYPKIERVEGLGGNPVLRVLFTFRRVFEDKTNEVFVKPFSSLVLGLLLGVKSLSNDLMDMFSRVSLSHIIVVSGYNLSIIAGVFSGIFAPVSRKLSFWLPLLGIIFFTILVGAEAPVLRAAIMASVILFSRKRGRKADSISLLLLAALIMALLNPGVLRFDPGFQLSFLSTLGILVFSDRIEHFFQRLKTPRSLTEVMSATLSAQIFIIPVVAFYFGRVSLIGPLANFIVLPFVPLVMLLSFVAVLLGFISMKIALLFSAIPVTILFIIIRLSQFLSELNFSSVNFPISVFGIVIYFLTVVLLILRRKSPVKKSI